MRENTRSEGVTFTSLNLEEFVIYRPSKEQGATTLANEMAALHDFNVKPKNSVWYFDGVITAGTTRRYVQKIPFDYLSIGGYEDTEPHTGVCDIWIQSLQGRKQSRAEIRYRLGKPAPEYRRFHEPFLWLANFSKYFVDYLRHNDAVGLRMFTQDFYRWLENIHSSDPSFQDWFKAYGDVDFRRVIAPHPQFLVSQTLQTKDTYGSHPLWDEVRPRYLQAIPVQKRSRSEKTIVTQYVFDCFKHLSWANWLKPTNSSNLEQHALPTTANVANLGCDSLDDRQGIAVRNGKDRPNEVNHSPIQVGDVIKVARDEKSNWKSHDEFWYAYVQGIEEGRRGQGLRILWLYRPCDTTCSDMRYPFEKELFLSDHCECDRHAIPVNEVVGKASVTFFGTPASTTDFYVRQRYTDEAFLDLRGADFQCNCQKISPDHRYQVGDTVLVLKRSAFEQPILEPVEIVGIPVGESNDSIVVRRLLRKGRDLKDGDAEPNELVYTHQMETLKVGDIDRHCHIRFYSRAHQKEGKIPAPYCRQGTGDAYYIITEENEPQRPFEQQPHLKTLRQGHDPLQDLLLPKLKVLDLFCGGGNFGRGIEEGGAAEVKWAVDYDTIAMHSYRANLVNPEHVGLFLGSVNDYLAKAMQGEYSDLIARRGKVDMIIAGSPCQGFSNLNKNKSDAKGQRNQSMVAAVAAFIDFYRPKYALLENVLGMAHKKKDKNAFSQMLCTLVGMGYQVHSFSLDAWTFGSPQSRSRLFISVTAKGLVPLERPLASHSHPTNIRNRSLGTAANGIPFGQRDLEAITPMSYVTMQEATSDLPYNHDARVTSVRFPDYKVVTHQYTESRLRLSCIPRYPNHKGLLYARSEGFMSQPLIGTYPSYFSNKQRSGQNSRTWQRTAPNALMPTVAASCTPEDSHSGRLMHWEANRAMTLLEARRAQGQPDQEVIVGSTYQQWKVVGNSVARTVALALGMALRTVWLANPASEVGRNDATVDEQLAAQTASEIEKATIDDYVPPTQDGETHTLSDTRNPKVRLVQPGLSHLDSTTISDDDTFVPIPSSPSTVGKKTTPVKAMRPRASNVSNKEHSSVTKGQTNATSPQGALDTIEISSDSDSEVLLLGRPTPHLIFTPPFNSSKNSRRQSSRECHETYRNAHETVVEETTRTETRIIGTTTIRRETLIPSSRAARTVSPNPIPASRRTKQSVDNDRTRNEALAVGASPEKAIEID